MSNKTLILAALLNGATIASATATSLVSQSFEYEGTEEKDVTLFTATGVGEAAGIVWSGFGTVTNQTEAYAYNKPAGRPISKAAGGTKILAVEGQVACAVPSYEGNLPAQVDMMVQIAKPEEALATPVSGEGDKPVQIALGVNPEGKICLWCKAANASDAAWNELTDAKTEGEWVRVTMLFDYAKGRCQLRLDGEPCRTQHGFATAATDAAANGSWYNLAAVGESKLSKLEVIGVTALDEVVVATGEAAVEGGEPVYPGIEMAETTNTTGVAFTWLDENNLAWDTSASTKANDGSGMTIGQKSVVGYKVNDQKKFEVNEMKIETNPDSSTSEVTLMFPAVKPAAGYKLQVVHGASKDFSGATTQDVAVGAGGTVSSAKVTIEDASLFYYKLMMVKETPANGEGGNE